MANKVNVGDKFGEQSQLEVTSMPDANHKVEAVCSVCNRDKELHGEKFTVSKYELLRGRLPCGCSKVPKWSKDQQALRVRRKLESLNYAFLGLAGEWKANSTKLSIKCDKGHQWETTTVARILAGAQCPTCQDAIRAVNHRQPDEQQVAQFLSTGNFPETTTFRRSLRSRGGVQGKFPYWDVSCSICANDEYSQAGLCTGTFTSLATNLVKGKNPCRCSAGFPWTQEQRELTVKLELEKRAASHVSFAGWAEGYQGSHSKITLECTEHGEWDTSLISFLTAPERHCPSCAVSGYDRSEKGFVYVLKIEGESSSFTGFGISNHPENRIKTHKRNLSKSGHIITDMVLFETDGRTAQVVESVFKSSYEKFSQDIEGFRTEATIEGNFTLLIDQFKNYEGLTKWGLI